MASLPLYKKKEKEKQMRLVKVLSIIVMAMLLLMVLTGCDDKTTEPKQKELQSLPSHRMVGLLVQHKP